MEDHQRFSAEQSLQIIESMIQKAKQDVVKMLFEKAKDLYGKF
jgi:hypothetical protein